MNETGQTIIKMIESLPFNIQDRILKEVEAIVADAIDESDWQSKFERKEERLIAMAKRVKKQVAAGKAKRMDYSKL